MGAQMVIHLANRASKWHRWTGIADEHFGWTQKKHAPEGLN